MPRFWRLWILVPVLLAVGFLWVGLRRESRPPALPIPLSSLNPTWPGQRNTERDRMLEMGPDAVPALMDAMLREQWRSWRGWVWSRQHAPETLAFLLPQPGMTDRDRDTAIWMLGELGPRAHVAVPSLRRIAAGTAILERRSRAIIALARIQPENPAALARAVQLISGTQQTERFFAAQEFGALTNHPGFDPALLIPLLADTDGEVRANAAYSIAQFGPRASGAVPQLRKLLADPYRHVSGCAAFALARIAPAHIGEATDAVIAGLQRRADLCGMVAPAFFATAGRQAVSAATFLETEMTNRVSPMTLTGIALAYWQVTGTHTPAIARQLARVEEPSLELLEALSAIGPVASNAIPRLRQLAVNSGTTPDLKAAAFRALLRVESAR